MKKILGLVLVLMLASPLMAADLRLVVQGGGSTIDVNTLMTGDKITLELRLDNLDFTLAGFEIQINYPTWLVLVDVNAVTSGDPPYESPLVDVQQLPADATGANTASTFVNPEGRIRIGGVIVNPPSRPSTGDHVLATLDFCLGRDVDINLVARTLATCISTSEVIEAVRCTTGAAQCPIFADETATDVVATNVADGGLTVTITNSAALALKGDCNADGALTAGDILPCIQCAVFGQASAGCPLGAVSADEYTTRVDVNCSGAATPGDTIPAISRALGLINRPAKTNVGEFYDLSKEGVLNVNHGGRVGALTVMEFALDGNVQFGEIGLAEEAAKQGWTVMSRLIGPHNVFKYVLVNTRVTDGAMPNLEIPYEVKGESARIAIRGVENFTSNNTPFAFVPQIEEYAVFSDEKDSRQRIDKE